METQALECTDIASAAGLGLAKVIRAALTVPAWEYVVLAAVLASIVWYLYLDLKVVKHLFIGDKVQLHFNPKSTLVKAVLATMKIYDFWPTPWLASAHLQTSFLHFFASHKAIPYCRELLITADKGTIGLDWAPPSKGTQGALQKREGAGIECEDAARVSADTTPIVIIVPGLTSHSQSQYIEHSCAAVADRGWRAVVVNHRGMGGVPITSNAFYNAGWTQDLRFALLHIQSAHPRAPMAAVGMSLGGNILVKYLGEEGSECPLQAACVVGCPWDLVQCDRWIGRASKQRLYSAAMATGLKDFARMHKLLFEKWVDFAHLAKAGSVRDFDDRITRHVAKHATVDTYYRKCSSAQYLPGVGVPLLAISALDDPICTREAIPWDECLANPNVLLMVTGHGGHLAYLEGWTAGSIWWVKQSCEFVAAVLKTGGAARYNTAGFQEGVSPANSDPEVNGEVGAKANEGVPSGSNAAEERGNWDGREVGELERSLAKLVAEIQERRESHGAVGPSLAPATGSAGPADATSAIAASVSALARAAASLAESASALSAAATTLEANRVEGDAGVRKAAVGGGGDREGLVGVGGRENRVGVVRGVEEEEWRAVLRKFVVGLGGIEARSRASWWLLSYVALAATCPLIGTAVVVNLYRNKGRL